MIEKFTQEKIFAIWNQYEQSDKAILNPKGKELINLDESRLECIVDLKQIILQFINREIDVFEFKTSVDSYNKRNNLWGFTATKGQMFFNLLVKNNDQNIDELTNLLIETISEPNRLEDALQKIEKLESFTTTRYNQATDKRKVAKPSSIGYFLSYFWQIHNNEKWPIQYTSLINSLNELQIWKDHSTQREDYAYFFTINEEIKGLLSKYSNKNISNWDVEHAFWSYNTTDTLLKPVSSIIDNAIDAVVEEKVALKANFDINDYVIPKVSNLVSIGNDPNSSSSAKGAQFEKMVADVFNFLDFEVEYLGQGSGRNPDAIIKLKEDHTAFLVDAKAYSKGYTIGQDDRAIREYINYYCPILRKEGFTKLGFIIVSNSFRSDLEDFVNDITWNTDIKRFLLLTSQALLYILAYKVKDKRDLNSMIEDLVCFSNPITVTKIIEKYDDV